MKTLFFILISLFLFGYYDYSKTPKIPKIYKRDIIASAVSDQLNPLLTKELVWSVIKIESDGNSSAVNIQSKNNLYHSYGLMQISRAKAIDYGLEPYELFDPETNILLGSRILSRCLAREASYLPAIERKPYSPILLANALTCYNVGEAWRNKPQHIIARGRIYARKVLTHLNRV